MQNSLPAGGLRLCRAGVEPAGSLREVSVHGILLSRAYPGAISVPLPGEVRSVANSQEPVSDRVYAPEQVPGDHPVTFRRNNNLCAIEHLSKRHTTGCERLGIRYKATILGATAYGRVAYCDAAGTEHSGSNARCETASLYRGREKRGGGQTNSKPYPNASGGWREERVLNTGQAMLNSASISSSVSASGPWPVPSNNASASACLRSCIR